MSDIQELIERLEKAEEGSLELSRSVLEILGWKRLDEDAPGYPNSRPQGTGDR